ncbi:hypothetical protein QPK24_22430 [Paenibacillus polygoni]|uniref:Uncharacterized protein n=1 Tax=Paenibacillus polygoni TaxID=3050112 RepID=A0ABY8X0N2_9BACL|nr:hypothetical protein [Paenibacillus polygoni]WIV19042.1 hypothetical protein QPK24_22430 [Paenibacillus polygoni]
MLFMIILLGIVILILLLDIRSKLPKRRNIVKEEIDKSRQVRKKLQNERTRYRKKDGDQ